MMGLSLMVIADTVLSLYCWEWMASCLVRMAFLFMASFLEVSWNLKQALCLQSSSFQDSVPRRVLVVSILFLPFILAADIPRSVHSWRKFVFIFHKSWLLFNYLCLFPFLSVWTWLLVSRCRLRFPQQQFFLGCWDGVWTEIYVITDVFSSLLKHQLLHLRWSFVFQHWPDLSLCVCVFYPVLLQRGTEYFIMLLILIYTDPYWASYFKSSSKSVLVDLVTPWRITVYLPFTGTGMIWVIQFRK